MFLLPPDDMLLLTLVRMSKLSLHGYINTVTSLPILGPSHVKTYERKITKNVPTRSELKSKMLASVVHPYHTTKDIERLLKMRKLFIIVMAAFRCVHCQEDGKATGVWSSNKAYLTGVRHHLAIAASAPREHRGEPSSWFAVVNPPPVAKKE